MHLAISRAALAAIRNETIAASPEECCGLLLGDPGACTVTKILPAPNVAADPLHRFEIDPAVLLSAHKAARAGGPRIVGHYHSHPAGEPVPSATDAEMAAGAGEIWLIADGKGEVQAWRASPSGAVNGRFDALDILISPESALAPAAGRD